MARRTIPDRLQRWLDARKRFHLSHAHVQMARELGLDPKKLGGKANHRQEPWKAPLSEHMAIIEGVPGAAIQAKLVQPSAWQKVSGIYIERPTATASSATPSSRRWRSGDGGSGGGCVRDWEIGGSRALNAAVAAGRAQFS